MPRRCLVSPDILECGPKPGENVPRVGIFDTFQPKFDHIISRIDEPQHILMHQYRTLVSWSSHRVPGRCLVAPNILKCGTKPGEN